MNFSAGNPTDRADGPLNQHHERLIDVLIYHPAIFELRLTARNKIFLFHPLSIHLRWSPSSTLFTVAFFYTPAT